MLTYVGILGQHFLFSSKLMSIVSASANIYKHLLTCFNMCYHLQTCANKVDNHPNILHQQCWHNIGQYVANYTCLSKLPQGLFYYNYGLCMVAILFSNFIILFLNT